MKVICDETNNTKEDMEKRQINITLVPETEKESEIVQKAKEPESKFYVDDDGSIGRNYYDEDDF